MTPSPAPIATYRLQLTAQVGFAEAAALVADLHSLGISHLYLSPIATAMPGSTHGYDWVPPPRVSEVLGGLDGLRALADETHRHGMGLIVDIVPNHVGVAQVRENPWFTDLLRRGPDSAFARYFDADFSADNGCDGALAIPVLASDGDLGPLRIDDDGWLRYFEHIFPTADGTLHGTPPQVHARQHYRLVPADSGLIGYRRFFAVNELAGLRQEDSQVYADTHRWLIDLIDAGLVNGVRVDHPDGLADPAGYLDTLRADVGAARPIYVEKILAADEPLEPALPVQGTTGYDQLRVIDAVFTDPSGLPALDATHLRVTGTPGDASWLVRARRDLKLHTLRETFPAEHRRLLRDIGADPIVGPDPDLDALSDATAELIADVGVYRADYPSLRGRLDETLQPARGHRPDLEAALRTVAAVVGRTGPASVRFAQTCGAVTAKSVEDSLFYRTARLVSAQEVGGDPVEPTLDLDAFHAHNRDRAAKWPLAMTATSTHDTKRGEDVRARVALLSQIPTQWSGLVDELFSDVPPPDGLTGYFLLQNMIGVWPTSGVVTDNLRDRLHTYAEKASREAGLRTSWTDVDESFESRMHAWIDATTVGDPAETITRFVGQLAPCWAQEALSRKAVALLGPGVPDIYQGTQWWEDSLVDPDNRRPVDYSRPTDHPKWQLVSAALHLRTDLPDAFANGSSYVPLVADGPAADHVVAFARAANDVPRVVLCAARFTCRLEASAAEVTTLGLPDGQWVDAMTGQRHSGRTTLSALRADGPVAMLRRVGHA